MVVRCVHLRDWWEGGCVDPPTGTQVLKKMQRSDCSAGQAVLLSVAA